MFNGSDDDDLIFSEMYLHVLWPTKDQRSIISPVWSNQFRLFIESLADGNESSIIAAGVFVDHIQLLIKFSPEFKWHEFLVKIKTSTLM